MKPVRMRKGAKPAQPPRRRKRTRSPPTHSFGSHSRLRFAGDTGPASGTASSSRNSSSLTVSLCSPRHPLTRSVFDRAATPYEGDPPPPFPHDSLLLRSWEDCVTLSGSSSARALGLRLGSERDRRGSVNGQFRGTYAGRIKEDSMLAQSLKSRQTILAMTFRGNGVHEFETF